MREDNVRKIWSDAELDSALADLHSDVEEEDGLAFARASLMAAAGGDSEAPPSEARRPWRWIAVAAAVVLLVGGLGVAAEVMTPDAPEPARPAATLPDLDRPLAPGEFRYAQKLSRVSQLVDGRSVEAQQRVELWIPADPAGVWHRRTTGTGLLHRPDAETALPNSQPVDEYGPGGVFPGHVDRAGQTKPGWNTPFTNWLTPDAAFVASLVPDQAKLVKRLNFDTIDVNQRPTPHTPTEALGMVRSVLELGLLRGDVRLALCDALNRITGIFSAPGQTPDGRPATVFTAKDSGQRLYLDPATSQLLAWTGGPFTLPVRTMTSVPRSSSHAPPTTTTRPDSEGLPDGPETVYSFAITRTSG